MRKPRRCAQQAGKPGPDPNQTGPAPLKPQRLPATGPIQGAPGTRVCRPTAAFGQYAARLEDAWERAGEAYPHRSGIHELAVTRGIRGRTLNLRLTKELQRVNPANSGFGCRPDHCINSALRLYFTVSEFPALPDTIGFLPAAGSPERPVEAVAGRASADSRVVPPTTALSARHRMSEPALGSWSTGWVMPRVPLPRQTVCRRFPPRQRNATRAWFRGIGVTDDAEPQGWCGAVRWPAPSATRRLVP